MRNFIKPGGFDPANELTNLTKDDVSKIDWNDLQIDPPDMKGVDFRETKNDTNVSLEELILRDIDESSTWVPV